MNEPIALGAGALLLSIGLVVGRRTGDRQRKAMRQMLEETRTELIQTVSKSLRDGADAVETFDQYEKKLNLVELEIKSVYEDMAETSDTLAESLDKLDQKVIELAKVDPFTPERVEFLRTEFAGLGEFSKLSEQVSGAAQAIAAQGTFMQNVEQYLQGVEKRLAQVERPRPMLDMRAQDVWGQNAGAARSTGEQIFSAPQQEGGL
jgi:hypothetical protein